MDGLIQAATDWLKGTDDNRLLKDVHSEFVTKDFCRNLTHEQTKQLFAVAMNNYVGIKNPHSRPSPKHWNTETPNDH